MGLNALKRLNVEVNVDGLVVSEYLMQQPEMASLRGRLVDRATEVFESAWGRERFKEPLSGEQKIVTCLVSWQSEGKCPGTLTLRLGDVRKEIEEERFDEPEKLCEMVKTLFEVGEYMTERHLGEGAQRNQVQKIRDVYQSTMKRVREEVIEPPQSLIGRGWKWFREEGGATVVDGCSVVRNSSSIAGKLTSGVAGVTGVGAGILLIFVSCFGIWDFGMMQSYAERNGDVEGSRLAWLNLVRIVLLMPLGIFLALAYVPLMKSSVGALWVSLATAAATIVMVVGIVFSSMLIGISLYCLAIIGSFRFTLNNLLHEDGQTKALETEGLTNGTRWIMEQVTLSSMEEQVAMNQWREKNPKADEATLEKERPKIVEMELRKKWSQFSQRAGGAALEAAHKAVASDNLISRLERGGVRAQAEAKLLIEAVLRGNFDKMVKNILQIVIGIGGIIAFILGGPVGAGIFAVLAVTWLMAGDLSIVHRKTCDLLWFLRNQIWSESAIDVKEEEMNVARDEQRAKFPSIFPKTEDDVKESDENATASSRVSGLAAS